MKFLVMFFVMATLIFVTDSAQAYNYDVGIYPEGAMRGYLMTETVRVDRYNGTFSCTLWFILMASLIISTIIFGVAEVIFTSEIRTATAKR